MWWKRGRAGCWSTRMVPRRSPRRQPGDERWRRSHGLRTDRRRRRRRGRRLQDRAARMVRLWDGVMMMKMVHRARSWRADDLGGEEGPVQRRPCPGSVCVGRNCCGRRQRVGGRGSLG